MNSHSIVSINDLSREQIEGLLQSAREFEKRPDRKILDGKVVATLFFEPSTRTRLSFETAVNRLGGRVIGFSDPAATSTSKGETLHDTIQMVSNYADLIIMRHYLEGAARYASEITDVPVINAGDGAHQHPSQTMLDLYTILQTQGSLDDIEVTMVGDLKYGRTVHSLLMALSQWRVRFNFVACPELAMPQEFLKICDRRGIPYTVTTDFDSKVITRSDILYMTRVQRERFFNEEDYIRLKDSFILDAEKMKLAPKDLIVLHPLPRVNEIAVEVDDDPRAKYFVQAQNGVYVRMALILMLLNIEPGLFEEETVC